MGAGTFRFFSDLPGSEQVLGRSPSTGPWSSTDTSRLPSPASPLDSAAKLFIRRRRARSSTRGSAVFLSVSNAKNGKGGSREDHSTGPRTASVYTSIYIGPIGNVSQR